MKSICVYLGANVGRNQELSDAVILLGQDIARHGCRLVYGGSSQGLMGLLANSVLDSGGTVLGIIPNHLMESERPLARLTELIITQSMQERKFLLQQHADAFIVVPGGLGTLEEAFETWNAIKMGILHKPIGFLNFNDYYNGLFSFIHHCHQEGFIANEQMNIPLLAFDSGHLVTQLMEHLS